MDTRAVIRTVFIVVLTAASLLANGGDLLLPWHPYSTYGFGAGQNGYITSVDAQASRAGLRAGDVIDMRRLSPTGRASLTLGYDAGAPDGAVITLPLSSGRLVTLRSHPFGRTAIDNVTDYIAVVSLWAAILLAAALVLFRPSPVTWAFYAFLYNFCLVGTLILEYPAAQYLVTLIVSIALPASAAGFVSFALRFPDSTPRGAGALLERALIAFFVPAVWLALLIPMVVLVVSGARAPTAYWTVYGAVLNSIYVVAIVILIARYVQADEARRNRLRWVVLSFAVAFLPSIVIDNILAPMFGIYAEVSYINLAQAWMLLAPIALAYTILRHRLFDIRFVVSRALLYGTITSITIALLALVDWGFGRWLEESRFALAAELLLAVFIGVVLTHAHRRIEGFLNRIIFRSQTAAMQALRRFAQETDLISDPKYLLLQTYEALRQRLESDFVAIYTADGSAYALATPSAPTPSILPSHDFAVLRLRRWHEPFECDEPAHPLRGSLLLPMTARAELIGFVICGPKRDRTHYLPEETETLALLTYRTGSAYALLTLTSPLQTLPSA